MSQAMAEENLGDLVKMTRKAMNLTQASLSESLGVSTRTLQRWEIDRSTPSPAELGKLAIAVHPRRPDLAERLARCAGTNLLALGLVKPQPPSEPKPDPLERLRPLLVEAVVSAAAEALDCPPRHVRPALVAAFERARQTGLGVEEVLGLLRANGPASS